MIRYITAVLFLVQSLITIDKTPIIGILMLNVDRSFPKKTVFVPMSYVKWVEQSGFRWMPISMYDSFEEINHKLNEVDGVLLTGGNLDLEKDSKLVQQYKKVVQMIKNFAVNKNDNGIKFGVFAICLGFESLLQSMLGKSFKMIDAKDINMMRAIHFTDDAFKSPNLLKVFSPEELKRISGKPYYYFHHKHGVATDVYLNDPKFANNFDVLAVMKSVDDKNIVTMIQHKRYPIIGTQFHPEKVQFEHYDRSITNRSIESVTVNQRLSLLLRYLVGETTNVIATNDLSFHKRNLQYRTGYKNYDEILVLLRYDRKDDKNKLTIELQPAGK